MNLIEAAVPGVCRAVPWITTSVIFLILVANTALRYASGSSLQWATEVPELLFPWTVMAGVVVAAALVGVLSTLIGRCHGGPAQVGVLSSCCSAASRARRWPMPRRSARC